ncbi:MAG: hypothetical protein AB7F91_06920 [Parvularculaceae bacterium]
MTAGIATTPFDGAIIKNCGLRRIFSPHYGMRIVNGTSEGPTPFLQIWSVYNFGEFVMRLDCEAHFRL